MAQIRTWYVIKLFCTCYETEDGYLTAREADPSRNKRAVLCARCRHLTRFWIRLGSVRAPNRWEAVTRYQDSLESPYATDKIK